MPRKAGRKTKPRKRVSKVDWSAAKTRYIAENLDPTRESPFTMIDLARDLKVREQTVRVHAMNEDWRGELRSQQAKRSDEAIARTRTAFADAERELRDRQATAARLLQAKALIGLQKLVAPEKDLTPREMVDMWRAGAEQERKARGIPDRIDVSGQIDVAETPGFESPTSKIARLQEEEKARKTLLDMFAEKNDEAQAVK